MKLSRGFSLQFEVASPGEGTPETTRPKPKKGRARFETTVRKFYFVREILSQLDGVRGEWAAERARGHAPPRVLRLLLPAGTHERALYIRISAYRWRSQEVIRLLDLEGVAARLHYQIGMLGNYQRVERRRTVQVAVGIASGTIPGEIHRSQAAKIDAVGSGRGNGTHFSADINNDPSFHVPRTVQAQAHQLGNSYERSGVVVYRRVTDAAVATRERAIAKGGTRARNEHAGRTSDKAKRRKQTSLFERNS
jgi:hypothetical protein